MATVSSTLKMYDAMTGPLKSVMSSMNMVIRTMEQMQRTTSRNHNIDRQLAAAKNQIASAESQINSAIEESTRQQNRFNDSVRRSQKETSRLSDTLKGVAATYLTIQGAQSVASISDAYVNSMARIDLINDSLQTTEELQNKIFAAADRARGSYTDMAAVIGRMGTLAKDAFSSNDELVAFTELMQKSFRVSGSSTMEQQAGMYQLSQAMAAGRLQGDEFRSIMENAPMLAQAIADFTGKSMGDLKEMSADGTITANIIKGAMFKAADDINKKIATMPMTFGDIANKMRNAVLQSFGPAIERISDMLNSKDMGQFTENFARMFTGAAVAAVYLLDTVSTVYNFFANNWPLLQPIVYGLVGALGSLALIMAVNKLAMIVGAVATGIQTAALFIQAAAVNGLKVAWAGLNTVMKANVYILIITSIIALITWLYNLWKTNDQFAAGLMRAWNAILNFFDQVPLFFTKIGVGIVNTFHDAKVGALMAMEDLVNGVVDRLNNLIAKLNNLKFIQMDFIDGVQFSASAQIEAEAARRAGEAKIAAGEQKAAGKAAEREAKVDKWLADRAAKRAKEKADAEKKQKGTGGDFKLPASAMAAAAETPKVDKVGKVGQVDKIKGKVDISSEDLKIMRNIAEMKNIQNFVTLTPTVNLKTGNINNSGDLDSIVTKLTTRLEDEVAASAKGVYN